jgi:hypothetical protein
MAISNFGELQTAVENHLGKDYDNERVSEWITLGLSYINRRLRIRLMETSSTLVTVAGTRTVALPTDYLQFRRLYIDGSPVQKLNHMSPLTYWSKHISAETSKPKEFTIEGENILLGPIPDTIYNLPVVYFKSVSDFSLSTDTNTLLTKSPDLYLYSALRAAYIYKGEGVEDKAVLADSAVERILREMHREDKRDRHSGDAIQIRTDIGNP